MNESMNRDEMETVYTPTFKAPRTFSQVVQDLWGISETDREGTAVNTKEAGRSTVPAGEYRLPSFEQLWAVSDDQVDWTDALVYHSDPERLIPQERWLYFHQMAPKILQGDLAAYVQVLQKMNPLGDMTPYVQQQSVIAASPDTVQVRFHVKDAYMNDIDNMKRYLSAIALRSARDLIALLPIEKVHIDAMDDNETLLSVTYLKKTMNKTSFGFLDPVSFTDQSDGIWNLK